MKVIHRLRRAAVGVAQWMRGRAITETALPRLALTSWTSSLAPSEVRRSVMLTAFRNRTWIEWAVYAACQLRRRGVATTLVYSSSEIKRIYPLVRVAGVDQLGFWAGVETIPDIRLVDLDHWRPRPGRAEAYARLRAGVRAHRRRLRPARRGERGGPPGPRLSAGGARGRRRCSRTPRAAIERILRVNPVSRLVCYSGLIGRSPAACEAARRAGVEVLTVEGLGLAAGSHDLQPERARPRVQPRGLAACRSETGTRRASSATRALLRFQEGRARGRRGAARALHRVQRTPSARAAAPGGGAPSASVRAPSFLLATNVVGDSSTLRRPSLFRTSGTGCGRRSTSSGPVPSGTSSCARIPTRPSSEPQGGRAHGRGRAASSRGTLRTSS